MIDWDKVHYIDRAPGSIVIAYRKFWRIGPDGTLKPIMLRKWQTFNGVIEHQAERKKRRNAER